MGQPQYLDDNGNPVGAPSGKVYLDDTGNPVAPKKSVGTLPPAANQVTAIHPQGIAQNVEQYGSDLAGDLKYGSGRTIIGRLLRKAGAQPAYNGVSQGAADAMASLPLGAAQMVQGGGQVAQSGKRWEGTKNIVGGALQAATIPGGFMAPEAPEAGAAVLKKIIPNTVSAGEKFQQVMSKAREVPINSADVGDAALRATELANSGGAMPKVIRDFLKRVTDPTKGPMTYEEARDFYSNASRLSGDEFNRLTPVMRKQVGEFTAKLGQSLSGAADSVGMGDKYASAMQEYRRAKHIQGGVTALGDMLTTGIKYGVPGAGVAYGIKSILNGGK